MKKIISIILLLFIIISGCDKNNQPKLVTHHFTKDQWVGGLMGMFSSARIHVNNYTPVKNKYANGDTYAYEYPQSSSISLPSMNFSTNFDEDVIRQDPYSFYVQDLNSTRFGGDAHDGYAYLTIYFEGDGVEIIGNCVNNVACVCTDPTLDLNNIVAVIPFQFKPKNGSVEIMSSADISGAPPITFTPVVVKETGPCVNNACAAFCPSDRVAQMQKGVTDNIGKLVEQYSSLFSIPFIQFLKTNGVSGPIVTIKIETNGDLTVQDKE